MEKRTPTWPIRVSYDATKEEAWYLLYYTVIADVSSALLLRVHPDFDVTLFSEVGGVRTPFVPIQEGLWHLIEEAVYDFHEEQKKGEQT